MMLSSKNEIIQIKLRALANETEYPIKQINGQRRFGPPPGWEEFTPQSGSEVYVANLPIDLYEDELIPLFMKIGLIYDARLMMEFSGFTRGFAYVRYTSAAAANEAIRRLNSFAIRPGTCIMVAKSMDNSRLYVGGLPLKLSEKELYDAFVPFVDGIVSASVHISQTKRKYGFLEFENHRAASLARRVLIPHTILLRGRKIFVEWAESSKGSSRGV